MEKLMREPVTLHRIKILGEELIAFVKERSSDIVTGVHSDLSGYEITSIVYPDSDDISLYEECVLYIEKNSDVNPKIATEFFKFLTGSLFFDTAVNDNQRDAVESVLHDKNIEMHSFYANSKLRRNLLFARVSVMEYATDIFGQNFVVSDKMKQLIDEIWNNVSDSDLSHNFMKYEKGMTLDQKLYSAGIVMKLVREVAHSLLCSK